MAILLRTPAHSRNKRFEFEITTNNRIQIQSVNQPYPEMPYTLSNQIFEYHLDAIRDLYLWLLLKTKNDGWILLGSTGEENTPHPETVEEWARNPQNPINGFYGLTNGRKGRFATFIPPILEYMGLAEVEHDPTNNRMRARPQLPLNAPITTRH